MPATFRDAAPADQRALVDLLAAQFADHSLAPPDDALAAGVARLVTAPELGRIVVAEVDGVVVGVAVLSWVFTLEHGGRGAWLDELYVAPAHRGRGIGRALLHAARECATAAGAVAMDLEVEVGHERVESLYERAGFVRHQRRRWFRRL
jgi:GNAT superfamily N-acetyltransferase